MKTTKNMALMRPFEYVGIQRLGLTTVVETDTENGDCRELKQDFAITIQSQNFFTYVEIEIARIQLGLKIPRHRSITDRLRPRTSISRIVR